MIGALLFSELSYWGKPLPKRLVPISFCEMRSAQEDSELDFIYEISLRIF